jgi:hypothetical protein
VLATKGSEAAAAAGSEEGKRDNAVPDFQLCTQQKDQKQQHEYEQITKEGNMLM